VATSLRECRARPRPNPRRARPRLGRLSFFSHDIFCKKENCAVGDEKGSYYFDDDHLSIYGYGASLLYERMRHLLLMDDAQNCDDQR